MKERTTLFASKNHVFVIVKRPARDYFAHLVTSPLPMKTYDFVPFHKYSYENLPCKICRNSTKALTHSFKCKTNIVSAK